MSNDDQNLFSPVAGDWLLLLFIAGLLLSVCLPSVAQQPVFGPSGLPQHNSGVFLPSNRTDSRGVERSRELIAEGEFSQAIRFLDEILARDEDSFVEEPSKTGTNKEFFGLKTSVRQLLKELPPEGRRIYETTFGPTARRLLGQVTEGDTQQLRQIVQRYFHTPAGHEAALMFAQFESDQGRHLSAALTYQQLLESEQAKIRFQPQLSVLSAASWIAAGNPAQATEALTLLDGSNYRAVELAGQSLPIRGVHDDKIDWFLQTIGSPVVPDQVAEQQWLMPRGNPARNGQADGGLPHLRVRWQSRLLEHENLEAVFDEMSSQMTQQKKSQIPAATMLAVGDYVVTRSAHGLVAFDFNTGKRIWRAQPQGGKLLQGLAESTDDAGEEDGRDPALSFAQRIWEDYLYNTTSSDGQCVYVIRDIKSPLRRNRYARFGRQLGGYQGMATNRLCAYDLATQGKLVWEVDGASGSGLLEGAFFLGAPVAVGQSLYCLVEIESETAIYLVALDRNDGTLQWRQQLADLEVGVGLSHERRLQALMPSYDEGMLICPTGSGVVVAVDLAKQALAWAYRYPSGQSHGVQQQLLQARRINRNQTNGAGKYWVHSQPVITAGRVLLTPPDSKVLYCLDLATGKLVWKQSRKGTLFLAGVEADKVLLVGRDGMTALDLDNGKPAWATEKFEFPANARPSGSGFFSQGRYYVPLSSSQVIGVDMATGELAVQTKSRDGQTLGNLICYRGAVLSQSGRSLDCFEQVDVLRSDSEHRLATDPTDFEALRTLGEIAFNEGRLDQSIDLLVKANALGAEDLRTREVLSEALVAALDEEFAKYQDHLPLLAEILSGTGQSTFTLMRLQAKGLQQMGRADEAFAVCLKAYTELNVHEANLSIGRIRQVSVQGWLSGQVAASWSVASSEQREVMLESFLPLLEKNKKLANTSLTQQFYDCFGALGPTDALGLALATEYQAVGESLAAQQIFLRLIESDNLQVRRAAIASCSRLLHQAEQPRLAGSFDRQLRGPLADQECLFGQTGLQCLEEWSQAGRNVWPYGQVQTKVQKKIATGLPRNLPHTGISLIQSDDILGSCNATLVGQASSGQNRVVTLRDSLGREFCRVKLDKSRYNRLNLRGAIFGVTRGNLLVLSLGHQIVAFDTFPAEARMLWSKKTTSGLPYNSLRIAQWKKLGRPAQVRSQANGQWLGLLGPVTHDSCLFQIDQRLVCVDSLSGETKWSRDDLPPGCELLGDEEFVLAVPKDSQQAMVFSTIDGRSLGETTLDLPPSTERITTIGCQVIRWQRLENLRWELSALDPWQDEVVWKYEFAKKAELDLTQNRFAVVADSMGHCVIVDLRNGTKLVDQQIKTNPALSDVYLLAGTDTFVVAVQQPMSTGNKNIRGFNRVDFSETSFAGQVYLFDRHSGQAIWDGPAEVQGLPLMLAQPVDLPMIAFAGNVWLRDRRGSDRKAGVMLLEKSSGRMLFHREDLEPSPNYFFLRASESVSNQAVVEMASNEIQIDFTERPRAPEPPMRFQAQRQAGSRKRGLQKIGEKVYEKSGWPTVGR